MVTGKPGHDTINLDQFLTQAGKMNFRNRPHNVTQSSIKTEMRRICVRTLHFNS